MAKKANCGKQMLWMRCRESGKTYSAGVWSFDDDIRKPDGRCLLACKMADTGNIPEGIQMDIAEKSPCKDQVRFPTQNIDMPEERMFPQIVE